MQKEAYHLPWISVTLILLAIATVGFFQPQTDVTGALVYRDYGYGGFGGGGTTGSGFFGGYGGLTITQFYEEYHLYIDAAIFLIIFLSIGKAVFLNHFNAGGKSLYVALGLALTLGLMMWEEQAGISVIARLGIYGVLVLLLTLFIGTYIAIFKATGSSPVKSRIAGILVAVLLGWILSNVFPELYYFLQDVFSTELGNDIIIAFRNNILIFLLVMGGLGIYLLFRGGFTPTPGRRGP